MLTPHTPQMGSMKPASLSHHEVISRLRGQTLRVPDLTSLFGHWPSASTNDHYPSLKGPVKEAILAVAVTRPSSERRQRDDLALLVSLWYPRASLEELQTLSLYTVWLVCWDDEVDANEGDLAGDFAKAEAWRKETLAVLATGLGLGSDLVEASSERSDPLHNTLRKVGRALKDRYTQQQRQHVFEKIAMFIHNCATEQKLRLEGSVPDYEDYMSMRIETVAGTTLCSLIEYSQGSSASPTLKTSTSRDELDKQVSVLLSLLNDLLSLKKELRTSCVINAVAALMTKDKSLDEVVDEILGMMKQAVRTFDAAAKDLEELAGSEEQRRAAARYIEACRSIVTGTLEFSWVFLGIQMPSLLKLQGKVQNANQSQVSNHLVII